MTVSSSPRAARLAEALVAIGSVTVSQATVLDLWATVAPELTGQPESLDAMVAVLTDLAATGVIELPAAASWDRSTRPLLPNFVRVATARRVARGAPWRSVAWRGELGWVASLRSVSDAQLAALVKINRWLGVRDLQTPVVPARLRSAEIFDDEKFLDDFMRTELFGEGRLSLELLRATRPAPPMAMCRVGPGPDVLVVENADPFWALAGVLSGSGSSIGRLGWGAGRQVEQTVTSIWSWDGDLGNVLYWGDLDTDGVRMARNAASVVAAAGLGPLRPHRGLWLATAALRATSAGSDMWTGVDGMWLGDDLWEATALVRSAGGRVAQERLSIRQLERALGVGSTLD